MPGVVSIKAAFLAVVLAASAGTFVQYRASLDTEIVEAQAELLRPAVPQLAVTSGPAVIFGLPDGAIRPLDHRARTRSMVPVHDVYPELQVPRLGTVMATPVAGCGVTITLRVAADATVELDANLPCAPQKDIVIRHNILAFSARTNAQGHVAALVPALTEQATIAILVDNIEHASATIPVPTMRRYDRSVLQWRGAENLQLHAFEPGAMIGEAGHIWSASLLDPTGRRGFVQRLGNPAAAIPYMAEVFTHPAKNIHAGKAPTLQIGVALTAENCGRGLVATTQQIARGYLLAREQVSLILPGCDAAGSIVMIEDYFDHAVEIMR